MTAENSTKAVLRKERDRLMERLRSVDPGLARELQTIDMAMLNLDDGNGNNYSGCRTGIEAIRLYLEQLGHTARGEDIADAIVAGGWRSKKRSPKANILDSVRYHMRSKITKHIKRFSGPDDEHLAIIGLYEWDDNHR